MFWNGSVCRLCSQNSMAMYYIFEEIELNIEMKLKRYLKLNVHKDDLKPKEICNNCYLKLEDIVDFLDMCYESNSKFDECLLYDNRKTTIEEDWSNRIQFNVAKTDENLLPSDLSLLVKDNTILELEPIRELEPNTTTHFTTNVVNLDLEESNIKENYIVNRNIDENQQNQSVLRHSSEYLTEKCNYNFCTTTNFTNKEVNLSENTDVNVMLITNENNSYFQCSNSNEYTDKLQYDANKILQQDTIKETNKEKKDESNTSNTTPSKKSKANAESSNKDDVNNTKQFSCNYCNKFFTRKENLKSHLAIHTKIRPFTCDLCNKSYALKWDLTCHKRIHTNLYQCKYCNKNFSFQSKLNRHVRTHTNDRPFACNFSGCTKRFSDKRNLITHKLIHSDIKNFTCNTCNKKFKTSRQLNQHHKVHVDDTPYKCTICSKAYKHNTNLLLHMKKHNGYICKFCKNDFQKLSNLLKHRKECKLTMEK